MGIGLLAGGLAFTPILVFQVRAVEGDRLLLCAPVSAGDEILYLSVNSIYQAPVQEYWRVEPDGRLTTTRVVSTPAVIGYYGIEGYTAAENGLVRAMPSDAHYRQVRMKIDARGQARLVVRGQETVLYKLVPEAAVVIASVHSAPRLGVCL